MSDGCELLQQVFLFACPLIGFVVGTVATRWARRGSDLGDVVRFIRVRIEDRERGYLFSQRLALNEIADAIERGEHKR